MFEASIDGLSCRARGTFTREVCVESITSKRDDPIRVDIEKLHNGSH